MRDTMAISWLKIDSDSPFSLANIPFGIISTYANPRPRPATAIGDFVLDLDVFTAHDGFGAEPKFAQRTSVFSQSTLDAFASLDQSFHKDVRDYLQQIFTSAGPYETILEKNQSLQELSLLSSKDVTMHIPMAIGDYTDFYAGKNHAYNVSRQKSRFI
jgi:fumarylacetoacetase